MLPAATASAPVAQDGLGLARAERGGDVGMLDVVEAGRPAARVAVGNLHDPQVRHAGQQRPRRLRMPWACAR